MASTQLAIDSLRSLPPAPPQQAVARSLLMVSVVRIYPLILPHQLPSGIPVPPAHTGTEKGSCQTVCSVETIPPKNPACSPRAEEARVVFGSKLLKTQSSCLRNLAKELRYAPHTMPQQYPVADGECLSPNRFRPRLSWNQNLHRLACTTTSAQPYHSPW
jgi:hypothetical protein